MAEDRTLSPDALGAEPWHARSIEDVLSAVDADPERGLSEDEVEARRERFGENRLPEGEREGVFKTFLRQFRDPLIYILLVAGTVSIALGNLEDAAFIFAVLLLNAALGTFQEYKAEQAAAALKQVIKVTCPVLREGEQQEVESEALVPGDVVRLEAGAAVPADIRLMEARDLRADESLLTGESVPVDKAADAALAEDTPLAERATLVHAGSSIASGRGRGVVCRTGAATEIGRIAETLTEAGEAPPLTQRMERFTRVIAVAVLGMIVVLGLAQLLRGAGAVEIFFLAVALAVSAIPAGLPVAITVALSMASKRMAERHVIVRRLPAVEGLGACQLIATDKTGTLTQNELTASCVRPLDDDEVEVTGGGFSVEGELRRGDTEVEPEDVPWLADLARAAALCNEGELTVGENGLETRGDTVDTAFLVLAAKLGIDRAELAEACPEVASIPFDSARRFAATFNRAEDGVVAHVKGAASAVAGMCAVDADEVGRLEEEMAERGFRVLAVAAGEVDAGKAEEGDEAALENLTFLGLVGLMDPVREGVPEAVAQCQEAGVEVRMVTGDHPTTALAIGRRLGIAEAPEQVVSGRDIAEAGDAPEGEQAERLRKARIYARVEPQQKTAIVEQLQAAGLYVAVTGDGVNDAPALRKANIGVAMGASGTDVARSAADLILTDDNFASNVGGIEEGRVAYDNVRKVVWLLISTGVAELVLFTLSVLFDTPLPLTPVQLLWLNLVTNGIQDIALAFERGEPGVLRRRPRASDEPVFNRLMIEEVLTSGLYMGLVAFAVFYVLIGPLGFETFDARNLLLLLLVLFENVHAFNVRSEARSAFRIPLAANRLLVGAVLAAQGLHILSMQIPGWRDVLRIEPVTPSTWGILLAITLSKFLVVEIYKGVRGRKLAARSGAWAPGAG